MEPLTFRARLSGAWTRTRSLPRDWVRRTAYGIAVAVVAWVLLRRFGSSGSAADYVIAAAAVVVAAFLFWCVELCVNFTRAKTRLREDQIVQLQGRVAHLESERATLAVRVNELEAPPSVTIQVLNPEPLPDALFKLAVKVTNEGKTGMFEARGFNATGLVETPYEPGSLAWEGKPEAKCEIPGGWDHCLWIATIDGGRRRLRFRGPESSYGQRGQQTNGMEVQACANTVRFTLEIREVNHHTMHREHATIEFSGISDYATLHLSPIKDS